LDHLSIPSKLIRIVGLFRFMDGIAETDDWVMEIILKSIDEKSDLDREKMGKLIDTLPEVIPEFISKLSELLLKNIISRGPNELEEKRKEISEYESKIYELWKEPIDLLEIYIGIAYEIGEKYNRLNRTSAVEKKDYTFEALTRLHARGCLIANEVLVLLKSGYPDGAHARWRTLHEIAVTSLFISKHGNDAAEPYLYYNHIESYKAACVHRDFYKGRGEEPPSDDEIARLKKIRDDLCKSDRFGANFKELYGWALKVLRKNRTNIAELEKSIGLDHLRPYYKLASNSVHSDTKGVMFKLAQVNASYKPLLTGPSYLGLVEAGDSAAMSLFQITSALLCSKATVPKPTLENVMALNIMRLMREKIGDAFIEVHNSTKKSKS
jgi:hypothetical protein